MAPMNARYYEYPSSPESDISSYYSTILSSNDTDHEEINKTLDPKFEFPKRNPVEYYQVANPYADSLWWSTTGDKGSSAIGKIQERVKMSRKRVADDLALPPPRLDSLNKGNKKVDSPIKNEHFVELFDDKYSDDARAEKGLSEVKITDTKYRKALEELIDTEIKYHSYLTLVNSVYRSLLNNSRKYKNILNKQEQAVIFANIDTLIDLSQLLIKELKKAIKKEAKGAFNETGTTGEQIASSVVENIDVGELLDNQLNRLNIAYLSYAQNHRTQMQELNRCTNFNGPKVSKWLEECAFLAKSKSECWDFESLLIKPIQRIAKYPLLIDALTSSSCDDISFENIQKLCDAKEHFEKMLERINNAASKAPEFDDIADTSMDYMSTSMTSERLPSSRRDEYVAIVRDFKTRYHHLKDLKTAIANSLPALLSLLDDHLLLAESWQIFMEYGDSTVDEHYIKSIYSCYSEKLKDQRSKTLLTINEIKNGMLKALKLALEVCETARSNINKHSAYRAAYINYMNKEKSSLKMHQRIQNKGSSTKEAQEYIMIENQIIDEVPSLVKCLDDLLHSTVLAYHKAITQWLKMLAGERQIEQYEDLIAEGAIKQGDNFDIIELHTIARHHTRMALEEFTTDHLSSIHPEYKDKNIDASIRIYPSKVIRRLFGTY